MNIVQGTAVSVCIQYTHMFTKVEFLGRVYRFNGNCCIFVVYLPEDVPSNLYYASGMKTASVTCSANIGG